MRPKIYYFHGFKSSGGGSKFETIKKVYGNEYEIISPSFPNNIYQAKRELKLIEKDLNGNTDVTIIGTSLGGFYAYYFASVFMDLGLIMINPVLDPSKHMKKYLGKNRNFKTNEEFVFTADDIEELRIMEKEIKSGPNPLPAYLVMLGRNDDLVDPQKTAKVFFNSPHVKFYDDDHRFNKKFETMLREERTRDFIKSPVADWTEFPNDPDD